MLRILIIICAMGGLWAPDLAFAQNDEDTLQGCPERPKKEKIARKLAGKWFATGTKLVEVESYGAAYNAFRCSLRMVEHHSTLLNAAKAARLAQKTSAAIDFLKRYLEMKPDGPKADGARIQIADLEALLEQQKEKELPKEVEPVPIQTVTEPEVENEFPEAEATVSQADDESHSKSRTLKISGWSLVAVCGVSGITGGVLQALSGISENEGNNTRDLKTFNENKDKTQNYQTGAIVSFAVAGASLAAGVTLLILSNREHTPKETTLSVSPFHRGLSVSLKF